MDHHLIFDQDSTDGTRVILRQLQAEGLPFSLFCDDAPGHLQQARSNHLTHLAAEKYGADWVLPLDADEILCGPDRAALEQALTALAGNLPVSLPLLDYHPSNADDPAVANPVLRLTHCQSAPSSTRKLFVPRLLALDHGIVAGKAPMPSPGALKSCPINRCPEYFISHTWPCDRWSIRSCGRNCRE